MKTLMLLLISSILTWEYNNSPNNPAFDENIIIRMVEKVDSTKRTLTLNCATERLFECSNHSLQYSCAVTNNKITLDFTGIKTAAFCKRSIGPATVIISLGTLNNVIYELEINVGSSKITGQISVTSGSVNVTLANPGKVQFINPDLNRVPDNTIYGTFHYHSKNSEPLAHKFIESLLSLGALPDKYAPGDYGDFQIEPNGQIRQIHDTSYYFTLHYIYKFTGNSERLKDLVKYFGKKYPDLLNIRMKTSKGEVFYSWTTDE
jgi:hypothetical protein